ncbi:MAG: ribonuclease R [Deltaproteobacteria bacterium]|nr:ribonuclease R [Deltaproteobacteria bacterium]
MKPQRLIGEIQLHPDGYGFVVVEGAAQPDIFVPARAIGGAMHRDRVEVEIRAASEREGRRGRAQRGHSQPHSGAEGGTRGALPIGGATRAPVTPHRDRVEVEIRATGEGEGRRGRSRSQRGGPDTARREGRITQIFSRHVRRCVGHFEQHGRVTAVIPDDPRIGARVNIPADGTGGARHGQTVAVQLLTYPEDPLGLTGKVIQILGTRGLLMTEIAAVIHHHHLDTEFPSAVEAAAQALCAHQPADAATTHRKDCRALPFVTIDGESAKDFDDAITVRMNADDTARVWVAIADVSHFVPEGSVLDQEALARGTSVYFPDRALPMLPYALSDDRCSLRPQEDRLVLVAEFTVDADGDVRHPAIYRGVIRSHARLTYTEVQQMLDGPASADPIAQMITSAAVVCRRLRARRLHRGSIDFDLPEPEIVLDLQGDPEAILRAPRHFSHQMIEELMLAANEVVARFLTDHGLPCVYRIHEPPAPEKMQELSLLVARLGIAPRISTPPRPQELARIVQAAREQPYERLVNHTLLRSMQQARYDTRNRGHFGLASKCYCHFTSPIRRYPDLLVHRLLVRVIDGAGKKGQGSRGRQAVQRPATISLQAMAEHCSRRERVAMEAEREMIKVYTGAFLQERIGEQFDGIIAHVTPRGCFVELLHFFVEGMIPLEGLGSEKFRFEQEGLCLVGLRNRVTYRIGDRVRIAIAEVNLSARLIRFALVPAVPHRTQALEKG